MTNSAYAASAEEIDIRVKEGQEFLANAKGVLIFPNIVKAGSIAIADTETRDIV